MSLRPTARNSESFARLNACLGELTGRESGELELDFAIALLDTARVVVLVLDREGRVVYANSFFEELFGCTLEEIEGQDWFQACVPGEVSSTVEERFQGAIGGQATVGNINPVRCKEGRERIIEWYDRTIAGESGEVAGLLAIGHDVTERVTALDDLRRLNEDLEARVAVRTAEIARAQQELERSHQLLEGSFDASTVALAYLDRDMRFVRVNEAYARADEKEPSYFVGKNHFDIYPDEDNERIFSRVRDTGEAYSVQAKPFEYAQNPERGVTHWDWTLTPVKDPDGGVTGLVLALRDVTARIKAIEALQESEKRVTRELGEKKVLLHEIHHRVKNNLQVVSSLLYLQASQAADPDVAQLFEESRDRVQAMALVHETLYDSDQLGTVDFASYLSSLSKALLSSYAEKGADVKIHTGVEAPAVGIEAAVPCGLIASELVTNALRYAFVGRSGGNIWVSCYPVPEGRICLEVRDDGVGVEAGALETKQSLGMTLVRTLTEQISGEFELDTNGGTRIRVLFPAGGTDGV